MNYKVGDFGYWEFIILKATKYGTKATPIKGHYKVRKIEEQNILLADDDSEIIVSKHLITVFSKDEEVKD